LPLAAQMSPNTDLRGANRPPHQRLRTFPGAKEAPGRGVDALRDLDALIEKGSLLHRLGKTEEAIAHFDAARLIAPGS
jgi:hypothetical protein